MTLINVMTLRQHALALDSSPTVVCMYACMYSSSLIKVLRNAIIVVVVVITVIVVVLVV